jgi:hypothetical protein
MEDERMPESVPGEIQGSQMSVSSKVFGIFYQPSKVSGSIAKKSEWLWPFLIAIIIGFAIYYATLPITTRDMKVTVMKNIEKYRQYMTDEQYNETMKKVEEGFAHPFKWYTPMIIVAMTFISLIVLAVISLISGNFIFGGRANFWIIMGVVSYAALIGLLGDVARGLLILAKGEMSVYTGLGLLMPNDNGSFLFYLFRQLDIFAVWRLIATSIGLGVIYKMKPIKFGVVLILVWLIFVALVAVANIFTGGSIVY